MLKGIGVPLLLVALVLAAATPLAHSLPAAISDKAEQSFVAGDDANAAAMRASHALVDLSGWELYLHSAVEGLSPFGLSPADGALSAGGDIAAGGGMASQPPPALPLLVSYQPQAPPFPV